MDQLAAQLDRIRAKVPLARATDEKFKLFGSRSHRYQLQSPVAEAELQEMEACYGIRLPEPYRRFMGEIGNGGAGPSYGIYKLGQGLDELSNDQELYLRQPCRLNPVMTLAQWQELTRPIDENEEISDEDFDRVTGEMYAGLLPVGTRGCMITNALILNGPFIGRVVITNSERDLPYFCKEATFLDWYESWLDEVIAREFR